MIRLVYDELAKTFLKKRTYIGFGLVLLIVPLIEIAMNLEGAHFMNVATRSLAKDFFFGGNIFNGWFIAYYIMNSLWFHIPLLISFVVGDQLAGEATAGTYRLILIRPVSRTKILVSKYISGVLYTAVFVVFLGMLSIGLAVALAGTGDLVIFRNGMLVLTADDVGWRFLTGYVLAIWTMITIASLSFFFSSFVENAIGPIVATMGLLILCTIISVMPLQIFDSIRDYMFTKYLDLWQKVFMAQVSWQEIRTGLLYLGAYSLASFLAAWYIFVHKDILT